MSFIPNAFQKKCEEITRKALLEKNFALKSRTIYRDTIVFEVEDIGIDIGTKDVDFIAPDVYRSYELIDYDSEDEMLEDYLKKLIFYLEHPEMRDRFSWKSWRSTWRWFITKALDFIINPDVPPKM